jgi:hypothetical protein
MLSKIVLFALSVASRGLKNHKTDLPTKQLRYISCYGNGIISPCKFLNKSKDSEHYYCGKCGCGDHKHTWLVREAGEYSKLDYPVISCPLKMPGFSNYDPNFYDKEDGQRKRDIENLNPASVELVQITVNHSEENERLFEKLNNIMKNS